MADFIFKELGSLGKSISVQRMEGNGQVYFRITKLFKADDGTYKPTKQGVSIPAEQVSVLIDLCKDFIAKESISTEIAKDADDTSNPGAAGALTSDLETL